ncbi:MAG: nitroreductase family deazaflavin-dependent oxidoreductase [Chloroflexi bacterium]|nr:nitroreductase family deazaflavin-dependent oxidoreductase [Chloroflexota bacterium]MBV9134639.1 nitroreductase family deazaflavin-dependent oxidoreductase [Chloroflexota bacterium]
MPFDPAILETAAREKEVEITTFGRKTGNASKRIVWIIVIGPRIYVRSGVGLGRDWPQNLLANGRAILHVDGREVPVRARHVTDAEEARSMHAPVKAKYNAERPGSSGAEPLTPAEEAVFELLPE